MSRLSVSEVFYSIQGEGMSLGRPSVFLRLAGCNLMCGGYGTDKDGQLHDGATWRCDTIEVWMNGHSRTFDHVLEDGYIEKLEQGAHLVVTGGEPLLQLKHLTKYLSHLRGLVPNLYVEVETNGTRAPDDIFDQYNVSPKLSNSGMPREERHFPKVISTLAERHAQFKFVISSLADWSEIERDFSNIPKNKIWLMPAGENQSELEITRPIAVELAKRYNVNYSERLQIVIWNEKTGV